MCLGMEKKDVQSCIDLELYVWISCIIYILKKFKKNYILVKSEFFFF